MTGQPNPEEEFGETKLVAGSSGSPAAPSPVVDRIKSEIATYHNGFVEDDVTLVILKRAA